MKFLWTWLQKSFPSRQPRAFGTVKNMFSISFLGVLLLLGASVITGKEVSYIKLETAQSVITAGDSFELDVYAYAHVPVNAVDLTLRFDESMMEVVAVDRGQSVLTIWTEDPVITKDTVTLSGGTFRKGFLGEHKIATINLKAKQTGQSDFFAAEVQLLAGDGKGTPVTVGEVTDSRVSLYVYDENQTPENIAVTTKVTILTDLNGDGKVGFSDVTSFMSAWADETTLYDFNGDGTMSFKDFSIILADVFFGE